MRGYGPGNPWGPFFAGHGFHWDGLLQDLEMLLEGQLMCMATVLTC